MNIFCSANLFDIEQICSANLFLFSKFVILLSKIMICSTFPMTTGETQTRTKWFVQLCNPPEGVFHFEKSWTKHDLLNKITKHWAKINLLDKYLNEQYHGFKDMPLIELLIQKYTKVPLLNKNYLLLNEPIYLILNRYHKIQKAIKSYERYHKGHLPF